MKQNQHQHHHSLVKRITLKTNKKKNVMFLRIFKIVQRYYAIDVNQFF